MSVSAKIEALIAAYHEAITQAEAAKAANEAAWTPWRQYVGSSTKENRRSVHDTEAWRLKKIAIEDNDRLYKAERRERSAEYALMQAIRAARKSP